MVLQSGSRKIAKLHFDDLQRFMGQHLAKEPVNKNFFARQKLSHLSTLQLQELIIDIYDELTRRKNNNTVANESPFLQARDDFHPNRNQTRGHLAMLSKSRLKDLVNDVLFDLGRRYPEYPKPYATARLQRAPFLSHSGHSGVPNDITSHDESRKLAKIHFDELQRFRGRRLAKEPPNSRSIVRERLIRLTKLQFEELTVDVYDELVRRNTNTVKNEMLFLPIQDSFHPKRNQARQRLATLPRSRFKHLAGDVLFELRRRYPEFHESEAHNTPGLKL